MFSLPFVAAVAWMAMGFLGLPLGVPPEKEEPLMAHVAPEDCVFYATWSAMATASASSGNQTEQLLAEPEVKKFLTVVERAVMSAALAAAKKSGTPAEQADQIGKTAQLWIRTVFTQTGAVYVARLGPKGDDVDIQGALIIKAGDAAIQLERSFNEILPSGAKTMETTVAGRPFRKLALPEGRPDLIWGANNGFMMIGLGPGALDEMSERIRARKEPSWLTQVKSNLPVERRSTISYVNIKKLVDAFAPLGGPEAERAISALGLRQLSSFQAVTGLDESGMISRTLFEIDSPPRGLWALFDEKGVSSADLKHVPMNALAAFAFAFDARKAHDMLVATMTEIDPAAAERFKQHLQQVAAQLGVAVPDVLNAVGTKWSFYSSPVEVGWPVMAVTVDVRNQQRLVEVEKRIRALFVPSGEIPNVGRIAETTVRSHPATTITYRAPQDPMLSPTWCITDKQLIVANTTQGVEAVMASQSKSLAEKPEVAARLSGGSGPLFFSYFDTPRSFAAGYKIVQGFLPMTKRIAQQAQIPVELNATDFPALETIAKHLRPSVMVVRRTAKGLESESRRTMPGPSVGASTGVMVALLLPAVQAAREAARRMQSGNHIKEQLLALQNFHEMSGALPTAYTVRDGKPLLSWRVAILPFLEQQHLYDQFRHDEPWDSEHNKGLIDKMPVVFRSPNSNAKAGLTVYLGVGGPQGVLGQPKAGGSAKGAALTDIKDGTSNTIAIVEASDELAVEWTKPEEWVPDAADPFKGLLGMRPGGFLVGFADGHTSFIPKSLDPKILGHLFAHSDGNTVQLPAEQPRHAPRGVVPPSGVIPAPPPGKAPAPPPATRSKAP